MKTQGIETTELKDIMIGFLEQNREGMVSLLEWFLNNVMEMEVEQQANASLYERCDGRKAYRNGYKPRTLNTANGKLNLSKPQMRGQSFETQVFDRYSRVEKSLQLAVIESYLQGVSTRNVTYIIEKFSAGGISASSVSMMSKELDEKVDGFLNRPIDSGMACLIVDATCFKVRDGPKYVSKALFVVAGIGFDGQREIPGARIADAETELLWEGYFDELKARGLHGVKMVISDGHGGIRGTVERCFLGASWQMCHVHFIRNLMKVIPKKSWGDVVDAIQLALNDPARLNDAKMLLERKGMTKAVDMFDRFQDSLHSYSAFPKCQRRRPRTSNMLERINLELKRRTRKIGAFPNDRSLLRLAVSILMNIDEEWQTERRYLNLEAMQ